MYVVQRLIHVDVLLSRCAHHSAKKLRDIGIVYRTTERHHGFRSRTVPAGGKRFFEENDLDALVICNAGRLTIRHVQTANLYGRCPFAESMNNLSLQETVSKTFLNDPQTFIQICCGNLMCGTVLHLNDKDWIHLPIVLLIAILIPVIPFAFPFIRSSLQYGHIVASMLRVCNDDPILQQAGSADFICCGFHIVCGRLNALCQPVEALRCGRHADDHRHGRQTIRVRAFQELLHDGGVFGQVSCPLRTAMGFVNDEVQPVGFLSNGIRQRLPNCILPPVRMLCQIAGFGELLCVQEIDVPILQHFHIKGIVADHDTLV